MSQYAKEIKHILATLNEQGDEQDQTLPDEEELDTIHVYPVEGGGILLTRTPLAEDDEAAAPPVIDSQNTVTTTAPDARTPPLFLLFLLLLCVFVVGDLADTQLIAMLTPTATIAIMPDARSLTFSSTATLGKLLSPITLTESQTVPTTGHGHQDARHASGTLTFYNGLSTGQSVAAGTFVTEQDGISVSVVTDASVTIPAANPPSLGETSIPAHAVQTGTGGNIPAEEINATLASGLYVKNLTAFVGGQDARDFLLVTKADRDTTATTLQAKVSASMTAALHGQLLSGQALHPMPCTPATSADHAPGEEAAHLTITVSETCTAVAYDMQQLQARATQLLAAQAAHTLGTGYLPVGSVRLTVTKATAMQTTSIGVLAFTCVGTFAYTLSAQAQQHLKALLAGQPRRVALRWLLQQRGIHTASITGIPDNQPLPDDLSHLHLLIVLLLF
ncbi:MAG: baseplate J/gp47 family protein [Ktedonobacteraceae bacterium]